MINSFPDNIFPVKIRIKFVTQNYIIFQIFCKFVTKRYEMWAQLYGWYLVVWPHFNKFHKCFIMVGFVAWANMFFFLCDLHWHFRLILEHFHYSKERKNMMLIKSLKKWLRILDRFYTEGNMYCSVQKTIIY